MSTCHVSLLAKGGSHSGAGGGKKARKEASPDAEEGWEPMAGVEGVELVVDFLRYNRGSIFTIATIQNLLSDSSEVFRC